MARSKEKLKAIEIEKKLLHSPGMYGDGGGLWLRVAQPSVASWCFRYMFEKRPHEMGLGKYSKDSKVDGITLKRAREKAAEQRRLKAEGQDPLAVRQAALASRRSEAAEAKKKGITFRKCAEEYIEAQRAGWKNKKHAAQWTATLNTYAYPIIGDSPVGAIDTDLVKEVLTQKREEFGGKTFWTARAETADRVRNRIGKILDWAKTNKYREGDNPTAWRGNLQNLFPLRDKVQKVRHHPALPYAEIGDFMATLRKNTDSASRALEFCILTATRTGEVLNATWGEINLKEKIWVIPRERMKAGKEHRVPLTARAIEILESLPKGNDDNFVFRSRHGGALSNMAMLMLLRRMDMSDLTVHGFRSTFRDWSGECTAHPREVIEHALAHQLKDKTEAAYQRGDLFTKRRKLMDDWTAFCATVGKERK